MDARIKSGHDALRPGKRHVVTTATRPAHPVEQTGVTCFNIDQRGFSLSREKQDIF
jgi:hypothetical protein